VRKNNNHQIILTDQDIVVSWLNNIDIGSAIVDSVEPINIYNNWCNQYDIDHKIEAHTENTDLEYFQHCLEHWYMPEYYKEIDVVRFINNRTLTYQQRARVHEEIQLFRERGMIPVLNFLVYLVDVCKENDIVLGVGRGSSVASYVLFLLGIHKVDSIKYELDIKEFLK